jgi:hypothetical protein
VIYCRINLANTNYQLIDQFITFNGPPVEQLQKIYYEYCKYKKFESVMPLFESQLTDPGNQVYGYFNNKNIVAFSIIKYHDKRNAESMQFAWDYQDPKLQLGIKSLKHECAICKLQGLQYLYLGQVDEYKESLDGFEIVGPA